MSGNLYSINSESPVHRCLPPPSFTWLCPPPPLPDFFSRQMKSSQLPLSLLSFSLLSFILSICPTTNKHVLTWASAQATPPCLATNLRGNLVGRGAAALSGRLAAQDKNTGRPASCRPCGVRAGDGELGLSAWLAAGQTSVKASSGVQCTSVFVPTCSLHSNCRWWHLLNISFLDSRPKYRIVTQISNVGTEPLPCGLAEWWNDWAPDRCLKPFMEKIPKSQFLSVIKELWQSVLRMSVFKATWDRLILAKCSSVPSKTCTM